MKKKAPFYWSRWDSNPRTTPCFFGDPKALPTELRLRFWIGHNKNNFFFPTWFNYIEDTGDNRFDTISLLGLQLIVEGVDRLDGHCLHNHDQKTHLKTLVRSVHGLWLSSTTRRNRHNSCLRWLGGTCHWSPHTSNVSRSNLVTGWLVRTCPWAKHNCRGLHTRFHQSRPLTNVVRVDRAGTYSQCTLAKWSCEGSWVNDHRPPSRKRQVSIVGRLGLNNPIAHYSRPRVPSVLVNVIQHGSVLVNLQQVVKFPIHEYGYIGTGCGSKFQDEL